MWGFGMLDLPTAQGLELSHAHPFRRRPSVIGSLSGSAERSTSTPEPTDQRGLTVFVRELCVSVVISSRRVWGSVVVKVMSVRFYTSFSLITQERYGVRVPCSAGG